MISEKVFIKNYTGFWNSLFPLHNAFMKGVILECSQHQSDIELTTTGRRFSFVSEVGFQIFVLCTERQIPISDITFNSDLYKQVEGKCHEKFELFHDDDSTIRDSLSRNEFDDAIKIIHSLNRKFLGRTVTVNPQFTGCSIIDTCYGDILIGNTLYEIKSVTRNFNIIDFRQLITYCALNYVSKIHSINSIGLYNPKRNMTYEIDLELFASAIAGAFIHDIYWDILNFISHDDTSK